MRNIFIFIILFFLFIFQIFFLNNLPLFKYLNLVLIFIIFFFSALGGSAYGGQAKIKPLAVAILGGLIMDSGSFFPPGFFSLNLIFLCFFYYLLAKRINLKTLGGFLSFSFLGIVFYQIFLFLSAYLLFFLNFLTIIPLINRTYLFDFFYFLIVNLVILILFFIFYERSHSKFLEKRKGSDG